jgi:endonuclease YncB( thermonuclease family)
MMIKRPFYVLAILGFAAFNSLAQTPQPSPADDKAKTSVPQPSEPKTTIDLLEGKVTSVESGDTIMVRANDQNLYWVRLYAIDAPDSGQAYFKDSKKTLSKLVFNKVVKVVVYTAASNGQLFGTVLQNGHDVGLNMLEKGMAWHFNRYAYRETTASRISYKDAQTNASTARIGLWARDNPIPPWVFRGEIVSAPTKVVEPGANAPTESPTNERKYILGPRGGCYYVSEGGRKVYVQDKSLCGKSPADTKP